MDELKKILKNTTEDELKSLLHLIFLQIKMADETEKYSDEQFAIDLKKTYHDFLNYKRTQATTKNEASYQAVHIVFGTSTSGSLNIALKKMKLQDKEKVISFSDIFSIGPVWRLHEKQGIQHRYEWLKNHMNVEDDYIDNYQDNFSDTLSAIQATSKNTRIIIWMGENAHEQTAARYVLYLLKDKSNDVFLMKIKENYKVNDTIFYPLHSGEMAADQLRGIYETNMEVLPLSQQERKKFQEEWEALATNQAVLRIWKNKEIHRVDEAYFDELIIQSVKELHTKRNNQEFMHAARVIGQVFGHLNQYIGDAFLEYRLRHLVFNGVLEIEGVPKGMRYYRVRLR